MKRMFQCHQGFDKRRQLDERTPNSREHHEAYLGVILINTRYMGRRLEGAEGVAIAIPTMHALDTRRASEFLDRFSDLLILR
jgi:hypothetical protein